MINKFNVLPLENEKEEPEEIKLKLPEEELGPKPGECWCSCNTCEIYQGHCHNELTGCRAPKHIRP